MATPDEILRLALETETQARDFYERMAVSCSVDFVKELLETLQNEETKHIRMIEHMLTKLESGKDIT
jgi:rubrerythrin